MTTATAESDVVFHFISDLHLQPGRPALTALTLRYLANQARTADAVYILGDLFEYWIGDDGSMRDYELIISAFAELNRAGVTIYFMPGNRDFAIGAAFARATGIRILPDPTVIDLYGTRTLLSHGDRLCTDDAAHQAFRARYTNPAWLARMLRLPVFVRRLLARYARWRSKRKGRRTAQTIMDVNATAVSAFMHEHQAPRLIHGHTHRPATHALDNNRQRIVLADWQDTQGEVLICGPQGCRRETLI